MGLFLSSCASVPLEYIEPAEPLEKGYTRYECKYSTIANASYWNSEIEYWYLDLNIKKGVMKQHYANILYMLEKSLLSLLM